jgi:Xaa-Pro aminopeptidase
MQDNDAAPRRRLTGLQARLAGFAVDALLLFDLLNIRYLTGFTGSDGVLFVLPERVFLLVDGRYTTQAKGETAAEVHEYRDKVEGIAARVAALGVTAVGFEAPALSFELYERLRQSLAGTELKPLADELVDLRAIKDEREVELLRTAAGIASTSLQSCLALLKPGMRERDFALELEFTMRRGGAEKLSFPTIVASGPNSALPHASPGDRAFRDGDLLVIDFGAAHMGYHSDETWTCIVGAASERQTEIYGIVKEAHDRAIAAVRPGVPCAEIDRIARSCIEDRGLGEYFSHGTGHGVGLDVHEAPRVAMKSAKILAAGMVVTVEPGIYLSGEGGVRIEDMVLVTPDGGEILTKMPKDLTVMR